MKLRIFVLLVSLASPLFAQAPIAVPEPLHTKLDTAQTNLENLQLKATNLQAQAEAGMNQLKSEFAVEQKKYNELQAEAHKELKVPADAVYDAKTITYSVPAKKETPGAIKEKEKIVPAPPVMNK